MVNKQEDEGKKVEGGDRERVRIRERERERERRQRELDREKMCEWEREVGITYASQNRQETHKTIRM